jgi:L-fuculose-phosphate aldolase
VNGVRAGRAALAAVGRSLVAHRLVVGSGGNVSVRLAGNDVLVSAAGAWLDALDRPGAVALVGPDGAVRSGAPSSEVGVHLAAYAARPDVTAVLHLHPQTLLLLDALGHDVRLIKTDHAFYVRRVRRTPFAAPGSAAVARLTAEALREADCVVLARHGVVVGAAGVDLAHKRALNLAEAAELTYRSLLLGGAPAPCPEWEGSTGDGGV